LAHSVPALCKVSEAAALGDVEPAAATKIGAASGVMDDAMAQIGVGTVAVGAAAIATAAITTGRQSQALTQFAFCVSFD
jgi:hypothetical protein